MTMDLMEMSDHDLYYDQPLPESIEILIKQAAALYHRPESEMMLLAAYMILPHHPTIHVALYRYYYKHRLHDALLIAERTLEDAGISLGFFGHWSEATLPRLKASDENMAMVRYYLLALKGSGFICLRVGRHEEGLMRLKRVIAMDAEDRLGARAIVQVAEASLKAEAA